MKNPTNNLPSIDLNVVPISFEALLLAMLAKEDNDRISRLKREIKIQEELLLFVPRNSPEYIEIKANLDEAWSRFGALQDFN